MNISTSSSGEPLASPTQLPASGKASKTQEADSCLTLLTSLSVTDLDGYFGKMSPEFSTATEEGILVPSSGRWKTWGIGTPTGCWTLNGSEHNAFRTQCPSADVVSSLSDILETTGTVPHRYFLSKKAAEGILRRADARGRELPPLLRRALEKVGTGTDQKTETVVDQGP